MSPTFPTGSISTENTPVVSVAAWNSNAPYLAVLKAAADPAATYATLRKENAASPGFYLDCSDFFEWRGDRATACRILSNLLELDLENRALMRAAASRFHAMGETEKALFIYRRVAELFPEEPQSHRDLALVLAELQRWQEAVDAMKPVFDQIMDSRFHGIEQIAANELAHIVEAAKKADVPLDLKGIDPRYLKPLPCDIRVVINWDTDASDMDLWVTDPKGEKCYYRHQLTSTGGHLSRDVTAGYGPEEFLIRKALPGTYKVQAHYYGTRSMKALAPVTLYAEIYTHWGSENEQKKVLTFQLEHQDCVVDVANVTLSEPGGVATTRNYQVRTGDTWESIAEKELGAASRAAEIRALNPEFTGDAPTPGLILRLPK